MGGGWACGTNVCCIVDPERALIDGFRTTDEKLRSIEETESGSTAVVVLIRFVSSGQLKYLKDLCCVLVRQRHYILFLIVSMENFDRDNTIYCANLGDSRCIVVEEGCSVAMSHDHKPDLYVFASLHVRPPLHPFSSPPL